MGTNATLVDIRRLLDAQTMTHFSQIPQSNLTDANSFVLVSSAGALINAGAEDIPLNWVRLSTLEMQITNINNGGTPGDEPTAIAWYLARDVTGLRAITPRVTSTFYVVSGTTATIAALIDVPYAKITGIGSSSGVYLVASAVSPTGDGTCTLNAQLFWNSCTTPPALRPLNS